MNEKDISEKDVDEKLVKWNDIFGELAVDAQTLVKDLSESIHFIAISALIILLIGGAAMSIAIIEAKGAKYIAMGIIIFCLCAANASAILQKWCRFRKKYKRLSSLQKETESD